MRIKSLTFQATLGWLEPLLHRIKESRKAVLVPIIDVIDDKTLEYYHGNPETFQIGSFTWSGHFTWIDVPKREIARRGTRVGATHSPTMVKPYAIVFFYGFVSEFDFGFLL